MERSRVTHQRLHFVGFRRVAYRKEQTTVEIPDFANTHMKKWHDSSYGVWAAAKCQTAVNKEKKVRQDLLSRDVTRLERAYD